MPASLGQLCPSTCFHGCRYDPHAISCDKLCRTDMGLLCSCAWLPLETTKNKLGHVGGMSIYSTRFVYLYGTSHGAFVALTCTVTRLHDFEKSQNVEPASWHLCMCAMSMNEWYSILYIYIYEDIIFDTVGVLQFWGKWERPKSGFG